MSDLYGGMGNNMNMNPTGGGNDDKKKKMIIIAGAGIIGVLVIIIVVVLIISSINNKKNNLYIDGKLIAKINNSVMFYVDENNVPYVCVEKLAPRLSYEFYNGEYGTGNENRSHCYVKNANEIALLEMDTNIVYKTLTSDESSTFDTYKMSYKVKRINDMLYISLPTMQKVFNVKYTYNTENNNITINTLPALYQKYNTLAKNSGYYEMSKDFSNQKALLKDLIVVISKDKQVGVIDTKKNTIIGTKYPNMIYSEGMDEFIVQQNGKYGVLVRDSDGDTTVKVGFEYDSLKLIDNSIGLYLVGNNKRYGVLDKNGKIIINLEYDRIGIENPKMFPTDNIKNSYVLYENCIPVEQNDSWGLFNVSGEVMLPVEKNGFGCIVSTSQTYQNVLLIPASEGVEGIVVSRRTETNKIKYGVIDAQKGRYRVPDSFDQIYKTVSAGETTYNMLFGNTVMLVSDRTREDSSEGGNSGTVEIN